MLIRLPLWRGSNDSLLQKLGGAVPQPRNSPVSPSRNPSGRPLAARISPVLSRPLLHRAMTLFTSVCTYVDRVRSTEVFQSPHVVYRVSGHHSATSPHDCFSKCWIASKVGKSDTSTGCALSRLGLAAIPWPAGSTLPHHSAARPEGSRGRASSRTTSTGVGTTDRTLRYTRTDAVPLPGCPMLHISWHVLLGPIVPCLPSPPSYSVVPLAATHPLQSVDDDLASRQV